MTTPTADAPAAPPADLPCHRCGYDLRAHPHDGHCPECGASVAEARRWAAIPRRPAWPDRDPRWRRRVVAGAWVLVLLPLAAALHAPGWDSGVRVPALFDLPNSVRTLSDTLAASSDVYQAVAFCVGAVLLFAAERGRRPGRWDRTRRWGVACCYAVLLLSIVRLLFIAALVAVGIAALFLSMPGKYQPGATQTFIDVGAAYLRYGPHPKATTDYALVGLASAVVLLACARLYGALRSCGPRWLAAALLAPLAVFAVTPLADAARYASGLNFPGAVSSDFFQHGAYFRPEAFVRFVPDLLAGLSYQSDSDRHAFFVEAAKWGIVLAVAVRLSVAQFVAWRRRGKTAAAA